MARPRTRRAAKESREKAEKAIEQAVTAEQKHAAPQNQEEQVPLESREQAPASGSKRPRSGEASPEPLREEKRQRVRIPTAQHAGSCVSLMNGTSYRSCNNIPSLHAQPVHTDLLSAGRLPLEAAEQLRRYSPCTTGLRRVTF